MASPSNWQNAIREVHKLIATNVGFIKSFNGGGDQQGDGQQSTKAETPYTSTDTSSYNIINQRDLLNFFDAELTAEEDKEKTFEKFTAINRGLGDIVRDGPQNMAEYTLLVTASMFLEPHVFKECVEKNASSLQVSNLVRDAQIFRELQAERLQAIQEDRTHSKEPHVKSPLYNEGLLALGVAFGIAEKIQELISSFSIPGNLFEGASISSVEKGAERKPPETPKMDNPLHDKNRSI